MKEEWLAGGVSTALESRDDDELMLAVVARDPAALRTLYDRHNRVVFALCMRVLRDRADAEDMLVEVFWELWDRAQRYDANRGSLMTYLVTLARSRAIDRLRSRRTASSHQMQLVDSDGASDPSQIDNPLEQSLGAERRSCVVSALEQLEPQQRQAIECAFYEGLSHSEISQKLNKPLGTVKTWIRQGLIRLRDNLRSNA